MLHLQHPEDPSIENQLGQHFPGSILRPSDREAHKRLALIFTAPDDNPHVPTLNIPLVLSGSPFQLKVWQALLDIPFGAVQSYGALATAIGHPGAARAVGTAVAANMLAYLVPCHRVIRACGTRGQYRWGPERKAQILDWETRELARANVSR
jgi:AraC family transcriptional regulator of adaptative response/methylated-DNA-[protein]-cysteine methyltransferase